jgi:hypothetical protein
MAGLKLEKIDSASSSLFFAGFMISKLRFIPLGILSLPFAIFSLLLYLSGYCAWLAYSSLAAIHHPEINTHNPFTYSYFKSHLEQYNQSSILGIVATCIAIAAIWLPPLAIVSAVFYLLSNLFWVAGEYNKYKVYKHDNDARLASQKEYLTYSVLALSVSIITVFSLSSVLLLPAMLPVVIPAASFISFVLSLYAFAKWIDSVEKAPSKIKTNVTSMSYTKMEPLIQKKSEIEQVLDDEASKNIESMPKVSEKCSIEPEGQEACPGYAYTV